MIVAVPTYKLPRALVQFDLGLWFRDCLGGRDKFFEKLGMSICNYLQVQFDTFSADGRRSRNLVAVADKAAPNQYLNPALIFSAK